MHRWFWLGVVSLLFTVLTACAGGPARVSLTVERLGEGAGRVLSSPAGIDCGAEADICSAEFEEGSSILLSAEAGANSAFVAWGGVCVGEEACTVVLDSAATVSATFKRTRYVLELDLTGAGTGGVRIVPPDVVCQEDCSQIYRPGIDISLLATPAETSRFVGWGGACSGNGLCELTVGGDTQVTAEFTLPPPEIQSFAANPASILAGDSALLEWEVLGEGTVTLEISPNVGEVSGQSSTRVSPSGDTTYTLSATSEYGSDETTATVEVRPSAELTVVVVGSGRVLSANPVNTIECGGPSTDCFQRYDIGQEVTLEAEGSVANWLGCQPSGATCSLTMDEDKTVSVTFR